MCVVSGSGCISLSAVYRALLIVPNGHLAALDVTVLTII